MKEEKRTPRTYKITESTYKKAMRRAKKEKGPLTRLLENVVDAYAKGCNIMAGDETFPSWPDGGSVEMTNLFEEKIK